MSPKRVEQLVTFGCAVRSSIYKHELRFVVVVGRTLVAGHLNSKREGGESLEIGGVLKREGPLGRRRVFRKVSQGWPFRNRFKESALRSLLAARKQLIFHWFDSPSNWLVLWQTHAETDQCFERWHRHDGGI